MSKAQRATKAAAVEPASDLARIGMPADDMPEQQRAAYRNGRHDAAGGVASPLDAGQALNPYEPGTQLWHEWVGYVAGHADWLIEEAGYAAAAADALPSANPHPICTPEHAHWAQGWKDQHCDRGNTEPGRERDRAMKPETWGPPARSGGTMTAADALTRGADVDPHYLPRNLPGEPATGVLVGNHDACVDALCSGAALPKRRGRRVSAAIDTAAPAAGGGGGSQCLPEPPKPAVGLMTGELGRQVRRRGIGVSTAEPEALPAPLRCSDTMDAPETGYQPNIVYQIPVNALAPDPDQPRVEFDPAALADLAQALARDGQESPINFRIGADPDAIGGRQLFIVHGERRWRAAQLAGLPTIDGILDQYQGCPECPADRILRQAGHNEQQRGHTPWDYACMVRRLAGEPHNMSDAQIAAQLAERGIKGKSRPVVTVLRLLHELPEWAQHGIRDGRLTVDQGKYLLPHRGRADVMEALGIWVAEASPAAPLCPAADDGDDQGDPPAETLAQGMNAEAHPITRAELREAIRSTYAKLYLPLVGGKWVEQEYLEAAFDVATLCLGCPQRMTIDGWDGKEDYCGDIICFRGHLAAHKAAEHAANTADPETAAYYEGRAALDEAWKRKQAIQQAQGKQIVAALPGADRQTLLAILLSKLLRYPYHLSEKDKTQTPVSVRDHLAQEGSRWLRKLVRSMVTEGHQDQAVYASIAEALGIELVAEPGAPLAAVLANGDDQETI